MSEADKTPQPSVTDSPPASGAWFETMPAGERKFFELAPDRPYVLESGAELQTPKLPTKLGAILTPLGATRSLFVMPLQAMPTRTERLAQVNLHLAGGMTSSVQDDHLTQIVSLSCAPMSWVAAKEPQDPPRQILLPADRGEAISPSSRLETSLDLKEPWLNT